MARYALADARDQAADDAATAYCILSHHQQGVTARSQQFGYAVKLVSIIQDRVNAHLDAPLDLKKARRDALQMRLQWMQMRDDLGAQLKDLSEITGIPESRISADPTSIPDFPTIPEKNSNALPESPGLLAAARAQIEYLRQTGQLQTWLNSLNSAAPSN